MLAANNVVHVFDYLFPIVANKLNNKMQELIDKQNSTGNTPLRIYSSILDYAVITDSKEMVARLLKVGANTNILN